jgi:hypothetical protein
MILEFQNGLCVSDYSVRHRRHHHHHHHHHHHDPVIEHLRVRGIIPAGVRLEAHGRVIIGACPVVVVGKHG